MPLQILCPDKKDLAFRRLVSDLGEPAAYLAWFRNGNKTPFTAEAEKLLGITKEVPKAEPAPTVAKSATVKSPLEILNTSKAVKLKVPDGTTMIRLTDKNGKKSVQPLGNFQKGANPAQGADIVKIEAGRIGLQKQFIPMDEPVGVEERAKQASIEPERAEAYGAGVRTSRGNHYSMETELGAAELAYSINNKKEARTLDELKKELPNMGLSQDQQSLIRAFLDSPMAPALHGIRFRVSDVLDNGWQGSYFEGLVEIARSSDAKTAPHEFAHRLWEFLPPEIRSQFYDMREAEIKRLLNTPLNATLIPQLEKLLKRETTGGSDFTSQGFDRSLYHLSSAEEFFTHSFSDKFTGENLNPEQKTIWGQIRDLFRSIIAAIKKFFKLPQSQDELLTNIMAGRYEVTPEGGAAVRQASVVDQTQTEAFKKWFGDSKVVDADGKPLVVYHGTTRMNVKTIRPSHAVEVGDTAWFSNDPDVASQYTHPREYGEIVYEDADGNELDSGSIVPVFLSLKNPLIVDFDGALGEAVALGKLVKQAKADGHDGLIIKNVDDSVSSTGDVADSYAIFNPEQVKHAEENVGTFDPTNPNIQASLPTAEEPEGELHQIAGQKYYTKYPELLTPEDYAKGRAKLVNLVQQDLFLPGIEDDKNIFIIQPDGQNHDADGKKLIAALTNAIETQNVKGSESAATAPLFVRMVNYNLDAWSEIFSQPIADELRAISAGSSSQTGQRLAMMKGERADELVDVIRNLNFNLKATYANMFGGEAYDSFWMEKVIAHFKDLFSDADLEKIKADHPAMVDAINAIVLGQQQQVGNRLFNAIQRRLNPTNLKLKELEKNALFQEEVATILEALAKAGIEEPKDKPKLTALEKLRLMVTDKNQTKINDAIETAISTGEIEAGKQAAINAARGDKEKLADLAERYAAGELPTAQEIEAGLQLASFAKWKRMRDNWAGYDPVTVRLARQVAADDFKGLRFGTPKEKPADTRLSIIELSKQTDAEITRVLEAYLRNIEANITMGGTTPETRMQVIQVIKGQLLSQIEQLRTNVRDAALAAQKAKVGVTLTPEQKAAQLVNAKLFSDPRLDLKEMVDRLAAKSPIQRLLPSLGVIVKQVLATPRIYQGNMTEAFVNEFVARFSKEFNVDPSQVAGLRKVLTEAFAARLKEASRKAFDAAVAKMTPKEKLAMPKTDKKMWRVFEQLANTGVLDSGEALKRVAAANGFPIPTPEEVAAIKRTVERIQELENPTPAKRNRIQNDSGLTPEEKAKAIKAEQDLASRANLGEISALQRKLGAQWGKLTKPFSKNPLKIIPPFSWMNPSQAGRNTSAAIYQFAIANILTKAGFPVRLFEHVEFQFLWSLLTRPPAVVWQMIAESQKQGKPAETWDTTHNAIKQTVAMWLKSLQPGMRAARAQMTGRGENRNVDSLLHGINALERAALAAEEHWKKGEKVQAALTGMLSLFRFPLRIVGALDGFQGEQVEFQEIRNMFAVEMAKAGKTRAETEILWQQAFGDIKREWATALADAQEMFTEYQTLKTPLPTDAPWAAAKAKWDAGGRENAIREAADYIVKQRAYQRMELMGLPAESMRAYVLRRRMGLAWQAQPGAGSIGAALYSGAKAWNQLAVEKNMPFLSAYFARAISNGVNYFGRFTPGYKLFTGRIDPKTGKGTDFSNETETDRKENFIRGMIIGPLIGGLLAYLIFHKKAVVHTRYPTDKKERERFIEQGHKPGTIEFTLDDGSFIPFSLNVGPMASIATYLVAAGAIQDLSDQRVKQQAKADAFAVAHGLQPEPIPHDWIADSLGVAARAGYQTILGGATATGLTGGFTEMGIPNPKKGVAAIISPLVPLLPGYQEVSRMAGVALDKSMAGVFDYLMPLPTSGARLRNSLGDPVETPNDVQRVIQVLTGGSYPFPVDPKEVAADQVAYQALFASGFKPPVINPGRGYNIGGQYRPMNNNELEQYTQARGQRLKEALSALGPNPSIQEVKLAYQEANQAALESVGVAPVARSGRSGRAGAKSVGARSVRAGGAGTARMAGATSRGLIRGSLRMPKSRRVNLRGSRASMRSPGKTAGIRGSSLRRSRSRLGRLS